MLSFTEESSEETENSIDYWAMFMNRRGHVENDTFQVTSARAICLTAMASNAKAIFAYTNTGNSPKKLAGFLPSCPIYAILDNPKTFRQLGLSWNIYPMLYNKQGSIEALVSHSIKDMKNRELIETGDVIVISGGGKILKEDKNDEFQVNKTLGGILKV